MNMISPCCNPLGMKNCKKSFARPCKPFMELSKQWMDPSGSLFWPVSPSLVKWVYSVLWTIWSICRWTNVTWHCAASPRRKYGPIWIKSCTNLPTGRGWVMKRCAVNWRHAMTGTILWKIRSAFTILSACWIRSIKWNLEIIGLKRVLLPIW